MKASAIFTAVGLLAGFTQAAPTPDSVQIEARDVFLAPVIFYGAADANYILSIPTNLTTVIIDNPLSVSKIESPSVAFCVFTGRDGDTFVVVGNRHNVDVAPPQPIIRATCDI